MLTKIKRNKKTHEQANANALRTDESLFHHQQLEAKNYFGNAVIQQKENRDAEKLLNIRCEKQNSDTVNQHTYSMKPVIFHRTRNVAALVSRPKCKRRTEKHRQSD